MTETIGNMVTGYTYNDANLVTHISHAVNGEEPENVGYQPSNYAEYTYYTDGNVRTKHESIAMRFVTYTYDGADRLTCENYSMPGGVILDYLYEYDAAGNRREKTVRETDTFNDTIQSNTVTSTFDKNNHLLTATENGQTTAFTYDLNGNMLTEGGKIYSYNARNQLTSYTENGQTTTYDYWIDGLRRSKTLANGDEEEYLWDGNNLVYINPSLSEYLLTGFTAYYGLGIFESNQNGTKYRYQRNAHGDTTALLNQSGDIVRCYIYEDAFGTSTYSADDTNPFRYAGQYYDRESQSYYLRARYYLPRYGRFSQQDTHWNTGNMLYGDNPVTLNGRQIPNYAAISQGLNLYTYCADNPVKYTDPSGNEGVAVKMFLVALFGNGEKIDYSTDREMVRTFASSPTLNKVVNERLEEFKDMQIAEYSVTGSLGFYGNDSNLNDLDLHLGVGKAEYTMDFKKEDISYRFLWMTWTETVYSVDITIKDTYNFDEYRDGASISNKLNNLGYDLQNHEILTPYSWSLTFKKGGL